MYTVSYYEYVLTSGFSGKSSARELCKLALTKGPLGPPAARDCMTSGQRSGGAWSKSHFKRLKQVQLM